MNRNKEKIYQKKKKIRILDESMRKIERFQKIIYQRTVFTSIFPGQTNFQMYNNKKM